MKLAMPWQSILFGLLLVSCSASKLPKIADPETLRKDCVVLSQQFPIEIKTNRMGHELLVSGRFIPKENWTPAISKLSPTAVLNDKYGLRFFIRTSKQRVVGYYVFFNPAIVPPLEHDSGWRSFPEENGLNLRETQTKGIYEFQETIASL